jgi:peptidyl-dipeptidase Dcp
MMTKHSLIFICLTAASLATAGCGKGSKAGVTPPVDGGEHDVEQSSNPLFTKSALQYEAPDYTAIETEHFMPAYERGMQEQATEVEAIATNEEPPTFENTIVALEKSGAILSRTQDVFGSLTGTVSDDEIRAIEAEMAPRTTAHEDAIYLDGRLFARVETIHAARDGLDPEAKRLVEKYHEKFVRAGAKLDDDAQAKIREINAELSELTTRFSQNLLKATADSAVLVDDRAELAGLSDGDIAGLAASAADAGHDGKFLISLLSTTRQPVLSKLQNRELRRRVWEASALRGRDVNGPLLARIVELRASKAELLGYATWAHYQLEPRMAKTPEAALSMLDEMAPKMLARAKQEARELQKVMKADKAKHALEPWDWFYYAEKLRAEKFDLDEDAIRAYLELDRVLKDGVFSTMNQLFGITFEERDDLPVYHPDVRTFEVFDEDGTSIGLFYADYFAREGKRGGAWMNAIVGQSTLLRRKPVIVNCLNIPKPAKGEPALLTFEEVRTMFHEMGHGVHGLFSDATYPLLAGTAVPRDYVEFPSQFQEDWALDPKILPSYAKHHETGEPISEELLAKLLASRGFNKGFDSVEYVAAALLDLEWHLTNGKSEIGDVEAFEQAALKKHGVGYAPVPPRYKSSYFAHVFAGGYSAGYYAYIWTEVLAADAFAHMGTLGGLSRANGATFREKILSKGNTVDPMQQYIDFRGQEPTVDALLKRRGLVD